MTHHEQSPRLEKPVSLATPSVSEADVQRAFQKTMKPGEYLIALRQKVQGKGVPLDGMALSEERKLPGVKNS